MPRPLEVGRRYVPGLDGIRAIAVICVIAYHLNVPGAQGGMLGVGVFFTLSGYLITDLLLSHWRRHGDFGLGIFWWRRARRLLPALFLMLAVVSVLVALFDASQLAAVRRQVLAAVLYFNNWSTIAQHGSYFARFAAPLPLDHLWSLAIEEQFYLIWPWLLLIGIRAIPSRKRLAQLTLGAAVISAIVMGLLYHPGYDPTRAYEGTDTRAFGLLLGAILAILWSERGPQGGAVPEVRNLIDAIGLAGLVAILLLVWRTNSFSSFLYPWGFVLLALASVALIAAVVNPASRLGELLGWGPLRWIGVRSYGIYLWQWPVIVLVSPSQSRFDLARAVLEVALTIFAATLSWRYLEEPIRAGALGRLWAQLRSGADRLTIRRRTIAASGTAAAVLFLPALGLAGALPVASAGGTTGRVRLARPLLDTSTTRHTHRSTAPLPLATHSSCRSVVYIGDSTSAGEISTDYIPNPQLRLPEQLADVGVQTTYPEISVARSIVETFQGQPNAATVAQQHIADGFHGCWILALGINEAADVAVGSNVGLVQRIDRMMSVIGRQPVLWVTAVTLVPSGAYAESGMQSWDRDLVSACPRYPNMRVFDWAAWAQTRWFIPDGIHYFSPGYVARSHRIAQGLVHAFPQGLPPSASCVVH